MLMKIGKISILISFRFLESNSINLFATTYKEPASPYFTVVCGYFTDIRNNRFSENLVLARRQFCPQSVLMLRSFGLQ